MENKAKRLELLREGFTKNTMKKVRLTGDWIGLRAVHQTDLTALVTSENTDYSHCMFHEVIAVGPGAASSGIEVGLWVVVIRNALDGLSSNRQFVVARADDVVMMLEPNNL